ncbi:hypothetical protein M3G43_16205 [Brevibacterium casei]|uniref:hypothetical protein n=1 Tax=Brevibacterium casei TaxID=33889 RepID=UPI00223A95EA|nr:hypothetical protein [Brevibacterium casei]MCT1448797.1 hypothetical protein [Brevibacterium casei]
MNWKGSRKTPQRGWLTYGHFSGVLIALIALSAAAIGIVLAAGGGAGKASSGELALLIAFAIVYLAVFIARLVAVRRRPGLADQLTLLDVAVRPERILLVSWIMGLALILAQPFAAQDSMIFGGVSSWIAVFILTTPLLDAVITSPHELRDAIRKWDEEQGRVDA